MQQLDFVFAGVGGQGIVVLSDIFCEAAILDGFDVTKAEIHGMAQRGGSITAFARISEKVESPLIETGKADAVIGFEILETARSLPMLKPDGTVIVNTKYIQPSNFNKNLKPKTQQELLNIIKNLSSNVYEVNASNIANQLGNNLTVNTILLGALSALPNMPIKRESFEKAMANKLKEKYLQINLQAFELGRQSVLK
ncbi:MAG: indolepyruvate oxidoreductase subunit beta [Nitrososphaerota archaeon]|jgi:indolepyruvate ferredoxin oxidoreductase beta subunit|nr:indolepyruvate oxidoreductase subunit beta [Nitrososphaerota archaeon]